MIEHPRLPASQQIVSARQCGRAWPRIDAREIRQARLKYHAGTHEMATKRLNGCEFLILMQRREPTEQRCFWTPKMMREG